LVCVYDIMNFVGDYIYIIRDNNYNSENVYRVCHGSDLYRYFTSSPSVSCVCFMMTVSASVQFSRDVLSLLRRYCTSRDDIGNDYFEYDLHMLIDMIVHIVMKLDPLSTCSFVDDGMVVDTGC
jgi:hypothetical protein